MCQGTPLQSNTFIGQGKVLRKPTLLDLVLGLNRLSLRVDLVIVPSSSRLMLVVLNNLVLCLRF